MRITAIALLLAGLLMIGPSTPAFSDAEDLPSAPISLRASTVIDDNLIYLGDLFENTGALALKPVAYAPEPGRQATYGAQWLYKVARHFDLEWQPLSMRDAIVIVRDSVVIGREEIEQRLLFELESEGLEPGMSVELTNRMMQIHLPTEAVSGFEVTDLVYDSRSRRLSAIISAPAGDPSAIRTRVTGTIIHVIEVPVAARHIGAGETIGTNDLEWIRVNSAKISRDTLVSASDIVGKTPRRGLRPGATIRSAEVEAPELVAKNSLVMITVEQPGMRLTAQGKALEAGALGDVIRITNTRSKTVIEAEVAGAGQAIVRPATLVAMN